MSGDLNIKPSDFTVEFDGIVGDKVLSPMLDSIPDSVFFVSIAGELVHANSNARVLLNGVGGEEIKKLISNPLFGQSADIRIPDVAGAFKDYSYTCRPVKRPTCDPNVKCMDDCPSMDGCALNLKQEDPSRHRSPVAAIWCFHDETRFRHMAKYMSRLDKLDTLQIVAGGLAHDFNNILTAIMMAAQTAKDQNKSGVEDICFTNILNAVERGRELGQQFMLFSNGTEEGMKIESIQSIISGAIKLCEPVNKQIEIQELISSDLSPILADRVQIGQVIQNLVLNAIQSFPKSRDQGKSKIVKVAASNLQVSSGGSTGLSPGQYVVVTVEDNGEGIKEDVIPRIFEPYYTTKTKGNGFGLALAYQIVRAHGGAISVDSEFGHGSLFRVLFPVIKGKRSEDSPRIAHDVHSSLLSIDVERVGPAVLVVDAEESVSHLLGEFLSREGFNSRAVTSGGDGINAFKNAIAQNRPYDVVLVSLNLGATMSGVDLLVEIRSVSEDCPVILITGHEISGLDVQTMGFAARIEKPFTVSDVTKVIKRVLWEDCGEKKK